MPTLVSIASRYRWELMLLVGIPLVSGVIGLLLVVPLIALDTLLGANPFTSSSAPFLVVHPILLAIVYFRVRALGRVMLTLAWAYSLVILTANGTIELIFHFVDEEWWYSAPRIHLWSGMRFLVPIIVLVWFARQASRISFQHALVLIALSTALVTSGFLIPHPLSGTFGGWPFPWGMSVLSAIMGLFAVWVLSRLDKAEDSVGTVIERSVPWNTSSFGGMLKLFTTRVLRRFDPARGRYIEVIIVLLSLSCLLRVGSDLRPLIGEGHELTQLIGTYTFWFALWAALTIGLAYAVRVRQPPERPTTTEPTATN